MRSRCAAAFVVSSFSCLQLTNAQNTGESLRDVLEKQTNLSSFTTLLTDQFPNVLRAIDENYDATTNPITILAPSENAFERIQYSTVLKPIFDSNDTAAISQVIAYHALKGDWTSQTLDTSFKFIPSLTSGTNLSMVTGGQRVGGVLQNAPPGSDYSSEIVFLSGGAERSVVTAQDIPFAGGHIQVINNFLIPPEALVPVAEDFNLANSPFAINSFLGAVYSTPGNLRTYLNETNDVTIFVPANVAFETVADAVQVMTPDNRESLLSYHILPSINGAGPLYSSDFINATKLNMLNNQTADLTFYPNSFFLNNARIVQSDIMIRNGVMHVIDVVLDSEATMRTPNPTSATQMPVLATGVVGGFNVSQAPFTTYLPNYIPTETPTSSLRTFSSSTSATGMATATARSIATSSTSTGWVESVGVWCLIALYSVCMFIRF